MTHKQWPKEGPAFNFVRTLIEIIEAAKANEEVGLEELRYAICATDALSAFDSAALRRLYQAEKEGKTPILTRSAAWQAEESFQRWKNALATDPKTYVGWNNDPANPEYQRRRAASKKLWEKVAARAAAKNGR